MSEPLDLTMECHRVQVNWTKAHFETLKFSIVGFAKDFIHVNQVHGLTVTRKTIIGYWTMLIWNFYGDGNPTSNRLESQVTCLSNKSRVLTARVFFGRLTRPTFVNSVSSVNCLRILGRARKKTRVSDPVSVGSLEMRTRSGQAR